MVVLDIYHSARNGNPEAESELFEWLSVRFRYLVNNRVKNREDGEELVQLALMAVLRDYRSLGPDDRFEAWAYKVLNNRTLSYFRDKQRAEKRTTEFDEIGIIVRSDEENPHLRTKLLECLAKVRKANTDYARILVLHFQGFKTEEICQKLDITTNNLYVSLARARSMITKCLDSEK